MNHKLPRWAKGILRATLPADWVEDILSDLGEEYARKAAHSKLRAKCWIAGQVVAFTIRFVFEAIVDLLSAPVLERSGWTLEIKQALRSFTRRPASALMVVVTTALAVGATTAVFSVVNGVLLRSLPYPEPEQLVRVWEVNEAWLDSPVETRRSVADRLDPSAPTYRRWLEFDTEMESLGAYVDAAFNVRAASEMDVVRGQEATSGFFEVLGTQPLAGRGLRLQDDVEGAPKVVVLSEAYWLSRYEARDGALGKGLLINGEPHEIVGVMPNGFGSQLTGALSPQLPSGPVVLWTPLTREAFRGWKSTPVIGRLRSGSELATANEQLKFVQRQLSDERRAADASGTDPRQRSVRVVGLLDSVVGGVASTLWFLLAAVALVLSVSILNISSALTARGLERTKQTALQAALGASRRRLIRGRLTESAVLGLLGGLLGVLLAIALLPMVVSLLPSTVPRTNEVILDLRVLACGLGVTLASACLAGTLPALLASRVAPQAALSSATRSTTHNSFTGRLRSALVVAEIAAAFVLLAAAGLLVLSFLRLWGQERGFQTDGVIALWVEPDVENADYRAFVDALHQRLEAIPGVDVTFANNLPMSGSTSGVKVLLERVGEESEEGRSLLTVGAPDYAQVLGIPLRAGRTFNQDDNAGSSLVGLVNESMAAANWPAGKAIGQRLKVDDSEWIEVVGVLADTKHTDLQSIADATVFLPAAQSNRDTNEWILRVQGEAGAAIRAVRSEVAELSPTTPVIRETVLNEKIAASVSIPRFRTQLVLALAVLSAVLALLGVYGLLSFSVAQRRKEIGVRMALGARQFNVICGRSVLRHGSRLERHLDRSAAFVGFQRLAKSVSLRGGREPIAHLPLGCGELACG